MKKTIAIVLCTLLALSAFACSAKTIVEDLTEKAEQIGEIGESLGELGSEIGESLGEIGSELGESLGGLGEEIGENLGEIGSEIGEGLGGMQIPNPFVDYETLEAAEKAVGFTLTLPVGCGNTERVIQVMDGKMLQVIDDGCFWYRKQAGDEDISGDYNAYPEVNTETVGDYTVTLKGSEGKVSAAIWTANGYSYAVLFDVPQEHDAAVALIEQVA